MRRPFLVGSTATLARNFTLLLRGHGGKSAAFLALSVHDPTLCDIIHSGSLAGAAVETTPQDDQGRPSGLRGWILHGSRFRFVGRSVGRTIRFVPFVPPGRLFGAIVVRLYARFLRHFLLPSRLSIKAYATKNWSRIVELARKCLQNAQILAGASADAYALE